MSNVTVLLQRMQISYRVHSYNGTDKAAEMQSRAASSANRPPSISVVPSLSGPAYATPSTFSMKKTNQMKMRCYIERRV